MAMAILHWEKGLKLTRKRNATVVCGSVRDLWLGQPDAFTRYSTRRQEEDDEGDLILVPIKGIQDDKEKFLLKLRDRIDWVGIEIPKIDVRFQNLSIEGDARVPTLHNLMLDALLFPLRMSGFFPWKKRVVKILQDVSGIVRPARMTLLLGPPGSGKTTLLKALSGKANDDMRVTGKITYCGHEFHEFVPQRTCAYISQHDLHFGEMTVCETLDFSHKCLGVGTWYHLLDELSRREREAGIEPDAEIDAFMKATAAVGQEASLITYFVLKILGLESCTDIMVGDEMRRGISGGQKKLVTTGEMLVGPAKAFFMDEISTGLDSSTTFQIIKLMRQMTNSMDLTMVISLIQPDPKTFDLFDDVILLSHGHIVYQGPRENVLEIFKYMGFKCPERKGVADFLQEVTSKKDQQQYWSRRDQPYRYISVTEFVEGYNSFRIGVQLEDELKVPYDESQMHPAALVKEKYSISKWELFRACLAREWLLMKRNSIVYIFRTTPILIMAAITLTVFMRTEMTTDIYEDASIYLGALFFGLISGLFNGMQELTMTSSRLPVFYKQRDSLFYPPWAFALSFWALGIPISIVESGLWTAVTYYSIGFAPPPIRFFKQFLAFFGVHQMTLSLFRFIAAAGRPLAVANVIGSLTLQGGFIIAKDKIEDYKMWQYYFSPMMYGQNAVAINEFLDDKWSAPTNGTENTVGKTILKDRGLYTTESGYWICIVALFVFTLIFNVLFLLALKYSKPMSDNKAVILDENEKKRHQTEGVQMAIRNTATSSNAAVNNGPRKGTVLPFEPISLSFNHVNYYVDMPAEMKTQGVDEERLQLLRDVGGAFRPGVLTALVCVSGAGKTTLMDVLAGRKTDGYIEGSINVSGYPKNQATFARVSGYCEQNDIHSPHVTVYESLIYSAWLRLSKDVDAETRKIFVNEVMDLVELTPSRNALVGLPGLDGLSPGERKRFTIAVELVANPSIIFMDEPTSGLDARAAAIVMRTVRNTADTGRTVVCTIHQPSIDVFEFFDELLLMKRGGQVIYAGPLGQQSQKLIEYFEAVPGVSKIRDGYNPATWMLEVSSSASEAQLNIDFAEVYANSGLYRRNQELIEELSTPSPGSEELYFPTQNSRSSFSQFKACLWKQNRSYWRNPEFNVFRIYLTIFIGVMLGIILWQKGDEIHNQQDMLNLLGATYAAVVFLGSVNASAVQSVVKIEQTVFYRERAARMCSVLPYAFAQVAIEAFYVAIQTSVYSLILYSMIGFPWTAKKFMYFYYFIIMGLTYFSIYGMMVVALIPGSQIASIVTPFFLSFWNLFAGFFIPRPLIPFWWRWYYWASPVAWTVYGIFASQVGDRTTELELQGNTAKVMVKDFLMDNLGYDHGFLIPVVFAHIAWVLLFFFVFAGAINFQKKNISNG